MASTAIDPTTGKPYVFGSGPGVWQLGNTQSPTYTGMPIVPGYGPQNGPSAGMDGISPQLMAAAGFDPNAAYLASIAQGSGGVDQGGTSAPSIADQWAQLLQSKGLTLGEMRGTGGASGSTANQAMQQLFDAQGNPVGGQYSANLEEDPNHLMMLAGLGMAGGFGAGTALMGGAAASTTPGLGGVTDAGGLGGSGLPGYSANPYAYEGTQVASSASGLPEGSIAPEAGGTPGLSSSDMQGLYGNSGYGSTGLQSTDSQGLFGNPFAQSGVAQNMGATNPALIDSAAGTPGYLQSSAGAGGGVGDLSGISAPTTGSSMSTTLSNLFTDPSTGGISGLGKALTGLGVSSLTGSLHPNTGQLNSVNYQQAATAMGQSARTNQTNAQGSLTYQQTGVDAQGNPTYSQNVALNAPYQQNLNAALGNQGTALGNLNSYNQGLPAAYANAPSLYGNAGSQSALAQQQQDAMYDQQKRYLDPQTDIQNKAMQAQLANQGVTYGSDAYNNAMTQLGSQQNQAYGTARDSAIQSGNAYANTLFNQNLQANQQYNTNLNNQGTNYSNQASGSLNGVVQNPTFAATPPATNYLGAAGLQGGANLNQYNANTGNANSLTNGLTNVAGAAFSNPGVWKSIGSGLTNLFGG